MFSNKTKYVLNFVNFTMIAVLLSACGSSTPSEANAKSELEKGASGTAFDGYVNNGMIKVDSLVKVNGQAGEVNGIKMYTIEYKADLIFLKDVPRNNYCLESMEGYCGGSKAGDKVTVSGKRYTMEFQQTEKGWKGPSGAVY